MILKHDHPRGPFYFGVLDNDGIELCAMLRKAKLPRTYFTTRDEAINAVRHSLAEQAQDVLQQLRVLTALLDTDFERAALRFEDVQAMAGRASTDAYHLAESLERMLEDPYDYQLEYANAAADHAVKVDPPRRELGDDPDTEHGAIEVARMAIICDGDHPNLKPALQTLRRSKPTLARDIAAALRQSRGARRRMKRLNERLGKRLGKEYGAAVAAEVKRIKKSKSNGANGASKAVGQ